MNIVPTDYVDDSRVTESVYIPKDSTIIVNDSLLESSMPIFVANITICYMLNGDIVNELLKSNIYALTEIHVFIKIHVPMERISDAHDSLVELVYPHMILSVQF